MPELQNDTRNWRCMLGLHQYEKPFHKGEWSYKSDFSSKNGTSYTCRCVHCGKIKKFKV